MGCPKADQEMNVVVCSSDGLGHESQISDDAPDIAVKTVLPFGMDGRRPVFGSENDMKMNAQMR